MEMDLKAQEGSMDTAATVVVVQRERFSHSAASLESLYENTALAFKLVYIDCKSPPPIRHYLEAQASEKGFHLIRSEDFLTPNQARNLGQAQVDTPYVVFADNDIAVSPGWLEKLVECAEQTGAWVVGPLYLEGRLEDRIIHMAGGEAHFHQQPGQRHFRGAHHLAGRRISDVRSKLKREPVETMEFHCMLVRNDVFHTLGPLDEMFMSISEQQDFCLAVREAGGSVYLEPEVHVSYDVALPLQRLDLPFFFQRWSDARGRATVSRMREKWRLSDDDPFLARMSEFSRRHRLRLVRLWFPGHRSPVMRKLAAPLAFMTERLLNRFLVRGQAAQTSESETRVLLG
jgi:GT2 family glycosyltransferase